MAKNRSAVADIVLTTFNARYAHTAFGLRYLLANLGELRERAAIAEFDLNTRITDALEAILAHRPRVVGIGVYIWNARECTELVAALRRLAPEVAVVVGGPEVSHESEQQEICRLADHTIAGEGDVAFAELCRKLLSTSPAGPGGSNGPGPPLPVLGAVEAKVIQAGFPEFGQLKLPYDLYTDADIAHRVVYVEASRGCPFRCEFCLSSLDVPVRNVPLERFLPAMQSLLDRGVQHFKFVDRTFNLNLGISRSILEFFLQRYRPGLFLHFEMIPDRLPEGLREPIAKFPAGTLQFEVGVQTFNQTAAALISRRQDNAKVEQNLRWLKQHTGVHVHADLIAGLPGEDLESFAAGFDRLHALGPQEIQVGILKRLRGTPIARHDEAWAMVYSPHPPYEILKNKLIDFATMQRLRRFARYWDLVGNSGNFVNTAKLIAKPFDGFWRFSEFVYQRVGRTHSLALQHLAEHLFEFLTAQGQAAALVAEALWADYRRCGRSDRPEFLRPYVTSAPVSRKSALASAAARRQARHLA